MLESSAQIVQRLAAYIKQTYGSDVVLRGDSAANIQTEFITQPTTGTTAQVMSDVQSGNGWGGWTARTLPDLQSFQQAVFADSTLTVVAKTQLLTLMPLLQANITNATAVQEFWKDLKGESLPWLDSKTISIVENYAVQFSSPLVSSTSEAASAAASHTKASGAPQPKGKK